VLGNVAKQLLDRFHAPLGNTIEQPKESGVLAMVVGHLSLHSDAQSTTSLLDGARAAGSVVCPGSAPSAPNLY
jgi:hypothetical protein